MAYFSKLGIGNKILTVESVDDSIATTEQAGVDFLNNFYKTNDIWKQTFIDGSQRKNYAGIGYKYDQTKDAFIPPQPYPSWKLDEITCIWKAPTTYPTDGKVYDWNETDQTWDLR